MSKRKVIMLTDSSLTYPKVMSPDAQAVLKRLEAYGAEIVYVFTASVSLLFLRMSQSYRLPSCRCSSPD